MFFPNSIGVGNKAKRDHDRESGNKHSAEDVATNNSKRHNNRRGDDEYLTGNRSKDDAHRGNDRNNKQCFTPNPMSSDRNGNR